MNFLWHFDERDKKYHNSRYKTFRSKNQVLYKHTSWSDLSHYNVSGRGRAQHELKEVVSYERSVQNRKKVYAPEFESRTKVEVVVPDSATKEIIVDDVKSVR
jgi:nitrogen regulatory protein PII